MKFLLQKIKHFSDYLVSFLFLTKNIFYIIENRELISKFDYIFIQSFGGYGHTFTMPDIARILFGNKFLYIRFFQKSRHNFFLPKIFDINYLTINHTLHFQIFGRDLEIGENNDDYKIKICEKILTRIIIFFSKKKVIINNGIYRLLEKKYPTYLFEKLVDKKIWAKWPSTAKSQNWISAYLHTLSKKKFSYKLLYFENLLKKKTI